ncbi:MAG: hypothetical protein AAFU85_15280, partial [Planctomycetota bacterium]
MSKKPILRSAAFRCVFVAVAVLAVATLSARASLGQVPANRPPATVEDNVVDVPEDPAAVVAVVGQTPIL